MAITISGAGQFAFGGPLFTRIESRGRRPSTTKKESKLAARMAASNTFEGVAREWHDKWKPGRTPGYADQVLRRLEADVFPVLGRRPIAEIEPPDVLDALQKIEGRGVGETARRIKQVVGQVFRYAIGSRRAKRDPMPDLQGQLTALPAARHHKAMPREDLPGFLRNIDTYEGEPRTRLALRLVTLTFVRTTELRAARWDEFEDASGHPYDWNSDIPPAQWRIPAARMKRRLEHIVPLSRQAVAALRELRPLAGNSDTYSPLLARAESCLKYAALRIVPDGLPRPGYDARLPRSRVNDAQ
jgi:integrase